MLDGGVQFPDQRGVSGAVIDLAPVAPCGEQAGVLQQAEVVRDGGAGHADQRGDIDHAFLRMTEKPEYAETRGVAELLHGAGDSADGRFLRHMLDDALLFLRIMVLMGQGEDL